MDPKEYYYKRFKEDFAKFFGQVAHSDTEFRFAWLIPGIIRDPLEHVPRENVLFFLSALGCTILLDQLVYTHFKGDYPAFERKTRYPKMQVGWKNAHPWSVFDASILSPRRFSNEDAERQFSDYADFFIRDIREFFTSGGFPSATWENIKAALFGDKDVSKGSFGEIFLRVLRDAG